MGLNTIKKTKLSRQPQSLLAAVLDPMKAFDLLEKVEGRGRLALHNRESALQRLR